MVKACKDSLSNKMQEQKNAITTDISRTTAEVEREGM